MSKKTILVFVVLMSAFSSLSDAEVIVPFEGEVNFAQKVWSFSSGSADESSFSLQIFQPQADRYRMDLNLEDVQTAVFDFSAVVTADVKKMEDKEGQVGFVGQVKSKYTLLNKKPVADLISVFDIRNDVLSIRSLEFGKYQGAGTVGLKAPFPLAIEIDLEAVDLADFIGLFSDDPDLYALGEVFGEIAIKGTGQSPKLEGRLTSFGGTIDGMEYDSILLNVGGMYPVLNVFNTDVAKTDGLSFRVTGSVDLSQKGTMERQIEALAYEPMVDDEGTDREWTLKRFHSKKHSGTTEIKYMMRQDEDKNSLTMDESSLLGVERKVSF